jgi:ankyrin repeat protein
MSNKNASPIPPQRWVNPAVAEMPPGFWKQQLPAKVLALAVKGDLAGVQRHLKEHPDDLSRRGSHGRTLLWVAARFGRRNLVEWLLDHGADIDATGSYNNETMVQITPFCAAAYHRHSEIAALLQSRGAQLDVFRAAFIGERSRVQTQLAAEPALLNAEDPHDPIYFVPLIAFPIAGGQIETAQALLDRGAITLPYSALLLHLAAMTERLNMVELLLAHSIDARAVDGGIFVACKDLRILQVLVDHGASVQRAGRNGTTPLAFAVRADKGNRVELVRWMLANGADVNQPDVNGQTALHVAAASGHAGVLQLLLDHAGDATLKDTQGRTPRDIALAKGKTEAAKML